MRLAAELSCVLFHCLLPPSPLVRQEIFIAWVEQWLLFKFQYEARQPLVLLF